jgi:DNA polymerase I
VTTELMPASGEVVPAQSPLANVRLELVNSVEQASRFMSWLGERRRVLGVDTESSGLKPERDILRLVQFGDLGTGWAIPWERWGGVAQEALAVYQGDLVMHNSSHDYRFLHVHAGWDAPWGRLHDTMAKAHLVDPTRPKGLKPLMARLVDPRAAAGQVQLDRTMTANKWTWGTVPVDHPHYWVYGALDPVGTAHIDEILDPVLRQRGYTAAYELEMATVRICAHMMLKGVAVDLDYCRRKSGELRDWVLQARAWITGEYGVDNATSNAQVLKRLQADGVPFTKRTASGTQFALDKEVLEALDHPLARYVLAIRRAEKICGSYLENFSDLVGPDGRVHASINPLAAHTSRMSITEPALQTLHRDDPTVREAFVPSAGNVLITCDADQIEARLATDFSRDEGLRAAFMADNDFFCEIASQIFQEPITKRDRRRQITKNTVYGKIYGAGAATIARTARVTPQVAEAFIQAFDTRFPGINQLMAGTVHEAEERLAREGRAYVRTPLGREIPAHDQREYALVNYKIQGHAAEVLKKGLVDLDAAGLGDYMLLPVHDEVLFDVPAAEAEEVRGTVERILTDPATYAVPLTWSAEVYEESWGQKYRRKELTT